MSDPKASYGEPVDEPKDADGDVVSRAQAGLADAEAARAAAAQRDLDERRADDESAAEPAAVPVEQSDRSDEPAGDEPASTPWYERVDDDEARWAAYAASADAPDTTSADARADARADETRAMPTSTERDAVDDAPTVAATPVPVSATEPVAPAAFGSGAQPIFVQAPEAPQPRGNRGAAGLIGLLAALTFALLYLAATLGGALLFGEFELDQLLDEALVRLTSAALWVPVVVFFLAFWFLGAIINRGRWGHWVVWGLLVGVASWAGHILGQLFQAPFWELTAREGAELIETQALSALGIVAFVLGRELTIWFGAWVARRGARMTELNNEAQREYERTLEAGPQLHRA